MKQNRILLIFFAISYILAISISLYGEKTVAMILGGPAIFLAGWAFIGHMITLDDDMPGEWSNPEASKKIWLISLGELSLKAILFMALLLVVYL